MFALLRLVVFGFLILSVVYIILVFAQRARVRRELREDWEEDRRGTRQTYVKTGLDKYENSLRRKLLLGVFIVPVAVVLTIIYVVNFR